MARRSRCAQTAASYALEHVRALDEAVGSRAPSGRRPVYRYYKSTYSAGGVEDRDASLAILDAETVRDYWLELRKKKTEQPKTD